MKKTMPIYCFVCESPRGKVTITDQHVFFSCLDCECNHTYRISQQWLTETLIARAAEQLGFIQLQAEGILH